VVNSRSRGEYATGPLARCRARRGACGTTGPRYRCKGEREFALFARACKALEKPAA